MSLGQKFKAAVFLAVVGTDLYIAVDRRDDIKWWFQEQQRIENSWFQNTNISNPCSPQ